MIKILWIVLCYYKLVKYFLKRTATGRLSNYLSNFYTLNKYVNVRLFYEFYMFNKHRKFYNLYKFLKKFTSLVLN